MIRSATGPITIAHDYFTQRGGAERVAAALINALEPDRIVTAMHSPSTTFAITKGGKVETTFLQRVRQFRIDPRRAMLAFPFAWRLVQPVTTGVVICSSSGWSHSIRTGVDVQKVVYCHNPARWLYQPDDYFKDQPAPIRVGMRLVRPLMVHWDRKAANSADIYIANSSAVARRIEDVYHRTAEVIHPPVSMTAEGESTPIDVGAGEFFLAVGRGRGYKNMDVLTDGFARLPEAHLVIVGAQPKTKVPSNVTYVSNISDAELRWLYAHCRALVSVSHEDFGLTPLEANTLGSPALVLRAGGFLDSLAEGISGKYIEQATAESIAEAVAAFPRNWDANLIREHAEKFSTQEFMRRLSIVITGLEFAA